MSTRYEQESQRLEKLSRAERFEELIDFPTEHTFKVIGKGQEIARAVSLLLEAEGYGCAALVERPSAKGTYLAVSFTLRVSSAQELDRIYLALEGLSGLAYLL
jgi:putative lipoic acid-binding regulatory protein